MIASVLGESVNQPARARMDNPRAEEHRRQNQGDPDQAPLDDAARANPVHVEAEEERRGNRHRHREGPPRRVGERVHDHDAEAREEQDRDEEDRRG